MLTDPMINAAGHFVSAFQLLTVGALLLCAAAILLAYRRELKLSVRRSTTTDELYDQLVRIANALERIANQPSDSLIAAASHKVDRPAVEAPEPRAERSGEQHHVAYSMFGR